MPFEYRENPLRMRRLSFRGSKGRPPSPPQVPREIFKKTPDAIFFLFGPPHLQALSPRQTPFFLVTSRLFHCPLRRITLSWRPPPSPRYLTATGSRPCAALSFSAHCPLFMSADSGQVCTTFFVRCCFKPPLTVISYRPFAAQVDPHPLFGSGKQGWMALIRDSPVLSRTTRLVSNRRYIA